ncbi:MAG: hypothetical protein DLM73_01000 [Chthoniobacterales bacterium]|nr:MAG: hypothetical protein DLM73_01000 [Chthoniobacterales bacterium]
MRSILLFLVAMTFPAAIALNAAPTPTPGPKTKRVRKSKPLVTLSPATPLTEGWSNVNGVWVHSDGYKYVNGQVIRVGTQTHKRPPKPPSKELLSSLKNKPKTPSAADAAAAKAAEKERNLRPRPAPQTGTNL